MIYHTLGTILNGFTSGDGTSSSSASFLEVDSPNSSHDFHKPLFPDENFHTNEHNQLPHINTLVGYSEPHTEKPENRYILRSPWTTSMYHYGPHHNLIHPLHQG